MGSLEFCRGLIANRSKDSAIIEPVHPFERGELDVFDAPPGAASADDLGLVEAIDRLSERVVIGVTNTADRAFDARLDESVGIADRQVLTTSIAVMDEAFALWSRVYRLLKSIERQVSAQRTGHSPANDAA